VCRKRGVKPPTFFARPVAKILPRKIVVARMAQFVDGISVVSINYVPIYRWGLCWAVFFPADRSKTTVIGTSMIQSSDDEEQAKRSQKIIQKSMHQKIDKSKLVSLEADVEQSKEEWTRIVRDIEPAERIQVWFRWTNWQKLFLVFFYVFCVFKFLLMENYLTWFNIVVFQHFSVLMKH